jgi:cytochrome c biogenesis protein CcdA
MPNALQVLQLPVTSYFPIGFTHIHYKFLYSVLAFNNLIPNNYIKFVFLIIIIIIIIIIIGTKFPAEPTPIFRIDLNKEIEHTYET